MNAIIVGSGPNGLAAAVALARAGWTVRVLEAHEHPGGGARTMELTLPGYRHDLCSAVHPLAVGSPFFRSIDLDVDWLHPVLPLAHPLDDEPPVLLHRSLDETADGLGPDGPRWRRWMAPLSGHWEVLAPELLGPPHVPTHPVLLARFGIRALRTAVGLQRSLRTERARALFAGIAAHSVLPLDVRPSGAYGLVLASAAHAVGWPLPRGGAQAITDALIGDLQRHGGTLETGRRVTSLDDLHADAIVLDVTPRQLLALHRWPTGYRRRLGQYRYGPGVFKLDLALDGPIPWRDAVCAGAGTVHLGGTATEIARSERDAWEGRHNDRPFVLLVQPTQVDRSRAPPGGHVVWAYCHVPHGSTRDRTRVIEDQVERFAPGFRERIVARSTHHSAQLEAANPNLVGGDINGGAPLMHQLLLGPARSLSPYTTPERRVFVCSASTPPGGGVHGMAGWHAARSVLARLS